MESKLQCDPVLFQLEPMQLGSSNVCELHSCLHTIAALNFLKLVLDLGCVWLCFKGEASTASTATIVEHFFS